MPIDGIDRHPGRASAGRRRLSNVDLAERVHLSPSPACGA
jgi:hypothetical protein